MPYSINLAYEVIIEDSDGSGHSAHFDSSEDARSYAADNVGVDRTVTITTHITNSDDVEVEGRTVA